MLWLWREQPINTLKLQKTFQDENSQFGCVKIPHIRWRSIPVTSWFVDQSDCSECPGFLDSYTACTGRVVIHSVSCQYHLEFTSRFETLHEPRLPSS